MAKVKHGAERRLKQVAFKRYVMAMRSGLYWLTGIILMAASCATNPGSASPGVITEPTSTTSERTGPDEPASQPDFSGRLEYEIVAIYPHSTTSFTQGLEFLDNGELVESVGRYGSSGLALIDLETGDQTKFVPLTDDLFAEGITEVGNELFQLTWLSGVAIVSNSETLSEKRRYQYEGEGWGLCFNGSSLVMSNGSQDLTFRDPSDFSEQKLLTAHSEIEDLLGRLNELECVGEQIWANVYFANHLVAIDSSSGIVDAWVDLSELAPPKVDYLGVMNGIAYRPESETFFVTGKNWPEIFELRFYEE